MLFIQQLQSMGTAILYASHYTEEVLSICSRIVILNEGIIVGNQSLEELYNDGINTVEKFENEMMKWIY